MRKVILKINPETKVIEDIGELYKDIPFGYEEHELNYPQDIMGGYYKLIDGQVVKDEILFKAKSVN